MVNRLRPDRIRRDHAVAQSRNEHRTLFGARGQQAAQQRAECTAGAGKGVLLAPDKRVQLKRQIPAARLADLTCSRVGQDLHFADRKAFDRTRVLPDLPRIGSMRHVLNRFDRKIGAKGHVSPLLC